MSSLKRKIGSIISYDTDYFAKGAYGTIHSCKDENNNTLAVKCIPIEGEGVPCLMECSIMSMFDHPYINKSIKIQIDEKQLYILQELAISDLYKATRGKPATLEQLRYWSFTIIKAITALHRQKIIHGDVKSGNILLYKDGSIKLTDFNVAVKKWSSEIVYSHNICTDTHRPLEVWLGREWSYPIDIWSIGCTLYELAYGELLFPYQATELDTPETVIRDRSINQLLDWGERNPAVPEIINVSKRKVQYIPFKLSEQFFKDEYKEFNSLILSMLKLTATARPNIEELISHSYFSSLHTPGVLITYPILECSYKELSSDIRQSLIKTIQRYTRKDSIIQLTLDIYSNSMEIMELIETSKNIISIELINKEREIIHLLTCCWIASKIIDRVPIDINGNRFYKYVIIWERKICMYLSFKFLSVEKKSI